ncbi:hypothetical protein GCM10009555_044780 [Acrocarpospora macrocephala]
MARILQEAWTEGVEALPDTACFSREPHGLRMRLSRGCWPAKGAKDRRAASLVTPVRRPPTYAPGRRMVVATPE